MSDTALEIRDMVAGYFPDLPILRGVSIKVKKGSLNLVIGPNGAGKSTLIKAMVGLVKVSQGSVQIKGKEIHGVVKIYICFVLFMEN